MDGLGKGLERITVAMAGEELIDAIRRREEKLTRSENLTMKFLEVCLYFCVVSYKYRIKIEVYIYMLRLANNIIDYVDVWMCDSGKRRLPSHCEEINSTKNSQQ